MTDRSFQRANDESRERLANLISTLTPTQLAIDLGEGWTVASALAHTGFWDRWQAARWAEMLAGLWTADDASIIAAEHLANDALHPYWSGIDAIDVPALALEAATTLDTLIASAPDALIDAALASPSAYLVNRFRHRGEHIDHIERSLAAAAPAPVGRDFVERNAASRKSLASLVERLRESDMALITEEGGWTVAQALAHVTFWDRSTASRWRAAQVAAAEGKPLDPFGIPYDLLEGINPPLVEMVGAWAGQLGGAIGREALAAAEEIDAIIESLADSLPDSLVTEKPNAVARWPHREAHIEQIERALAEGRSSAAPVDRSYIARNGSSLTRLQDILARLSQADLDRRSGERRCGERQSGEGSWTVGQILGHLTFWDRFLSARWRAAQAGGPGEQPSYFPHELADLLNDGQPATWQAVASGSPETAIAETLAAAEEVDAIIAGLPESAPIEAVLAERPALLDRSIHRLEHLATIERAIGGGAHAGQGWRNTR
jgi:DinB superfamily/Mycothiol maleylpyruvate isomerase N-terminal domain